MAQYRVIQDIEAEDKLLGPLSLRQFIYAVITIVLLFISFKLFLVQPFLVIPLLPAAALFGVLAAPFGHDQSSEIWLLAKIRFLLKPQRRIWDQSGLQELVTITVPKKVEAPTTNGLNQDQVKSRLEALAQTIDTRGWVVKGVNVNMFANPDYTANQTDRLVDASSIPASPVADVDIRSDDDILDEHNNPVAQQMDQLVRAKDQAHREALLGQMQQARQAANVAAGGVAAETVDDTVGGAGPVVTPQAPQPQPVFGAPYNQPAQSYAAAQPAAPPKISAFYTPNPAPSVPAQQQAAPVAPNPAPAPINNQPNPGILGLANNDDLSVATIARQARKDEPSSDGEVVISLR